MCFVGLFPLIKFPQTHSRTRDDAKAKLSCIASRRANISWAIRSSSFWKMLTISHWHWDFVCVCVGGGGGLMCLICYGMREKNRSWWIPFHCNNPCKTRGRNKHGRGVGNKTKKISPPWFNPFRTKTPKYLFPRGNKPLLYHQIGNRNFFIFITNQ